MFTYMHFYACWHETPATKHFQNCLIYCDCCCLFFLSLLLLLSRATRGIMANIVVDVFYFTPLFHIYLFIYFIGSFGCVCVRACSHVSDWHEACMYVCMYACNRALRTTLRVCHVCKPVYVRAWPTSM